MFSGSSANATTYVSTLNKEFKTIAFPYDDITVTIHIETKLHYLKGNSKKKDIVRTLQIHEKAVSIFTQNGWNSNNQLLIDTVDVGKIQLEVGEGMNLKFEETLRLKAFVHQCDFPMTKYRGGDISKFFENTVLKKVEKCLTYNEKLQR